MVHASVCQVHAVSIDLQEHKGSIQYEKGIVSGHSKDKTGPLRYKPVDRGTTVLTITM